VITRGLKLARLEGSTTGKNTPGDARELISERDRQHVVMKPLLGGLDPKLEPVTLPLGWLHLDQHDPSCLHEQDAGIDYRAWISCPDRAIPGRDLLRDQAEPCGEVTPFSEGIAGRNVHSTILKAVKNRVPNRIHGISGLRFKHSRSNRSITRWVSRSSLGGATASIKPCGHLRSSTMSHKTRVSLGGMRSRL
jgi:hypothetical protein